MNGDTLVRFGVGMPAGLLAQFDRLVTTKGYANRSEAMRELVRLALLEQAWEDEAGHTTAVLTLVYNHNSGVGDILTGLQHAHSGAIVCSMHIHIDEHRCLEVVVLRGEAGVVKSIAHQLCGARGVQYGKLMAAAMHGEGGHAHT